MPSKSEELRMIADAELRLNGAPPLQDNEGFFTVTQGKKVIIARGWVREYSLQMRGGADAFVVTLVGATVSHEDA